MRRVVTLGVFVALALGLGLSGSASSALPSLSTTDPRASVRPNALRAAAPPPFRYRYMFSSGQDPAAAKSLGYNLVDVGSKSEADALPHGTQALLYLGVGAAWDDAVCSWELSDATITRTVRSTAHDPKVAGYFFSDEPDPAKCPNAVSAHRARAALIRSLAPTKFTLMVIDSNSGQATLNQIPLWVGVADYAGLDVYPCYQGRPCDFHWQKQVIAAADAVGLTYFGGVQAFRDAHDWRWPTADELQTQLDTWKASRARGYMLFAWTWAGYKLSTEPALLDTLSRFNRGGSSSSAPLGTPRPRPRLEKVAFSVSTNRPRPRHDLGAKLRFRFTSGATTNKGVRMWCDARVGTTPLRRFSHVLKPGDGACRWHIPAGSSGQMVSGSIRIQYGTSKLYEKFGLRIH